MSIELTEVQNSIIKEIASKEGLYQYELNVTPGSMKGDGYLGIITSVSVKSDKRSLDLIIKSAHTDEKFRQKAPVTHSYRIEIFVYEEVFPAFSIFQKEYNVLDGFSGYAKIYGSSIKESNECLVLENLKEMGYRLWSKSAPMNSEHLAAVITEYGKFHAVSLAMKNKKPDVYTRLTEGIKGDFDFKNSDSMTQLWKGVLSRMVEGGLKAVESNHAAMEAMQRFSENMDNFFHELSEVEEDQTVILHGDCWNNNMMFQYEDPRHTTKPKSVCFIDWQMSRISSPVLDLAYFFFVCSSKDDLLQYNKYLKIYHNSLSKMLSKFSCDVETIFPFAVLESHWKKLSKFGLLAGIMIIKIILSDANEVPDLAEAAEATFVESLFNNSISTKGYEQRIIDIVSVMSENGLI